MKRIGILLTILWTSILCNVCGQNTIEFNYDDNGNRISRSLEVIQLKSSSITFPVELNKLDTLNLMNSDRIRVWPNPFSHSIHIRIDTRNNKEKCSATIYSLSGLELHSYSNLCDETELDLNSLGDGVFFLRLKLGTEIFNYKIVKHN